MILKRHILHILPAVLMALICLDGSARINKAQRSTAFSQKKASVENVEEQSSAPKSKKKKNAKAETERETVLKDVYLFGVSRSYADSITYFTNISLIRNAVFDKATGFIDGIRLYTEQLENHLLQGGHTGYISATFYAKTRKKAEKIYTRLRKKTVKKSHTRIEPLGDFEYRFVSPENIYRNILPQTEEEEDIQEEE